MIEAIGHLSTNAELKAFSAFVLRQSDVGVLPAYSRIDLMEIPYLVPHVYVFDVLNSSSSLVLKYCGTKVDEFYGMNMSGRCLADHASGEGSFSEIEGIFFQGILTKKPTYAIRSVHLVNEYVDKFRVAECIMFPCSSDGQTVDYTIGFADYFDSSSSIEKQITLIE